MTAPAADITLITPTTRPHLLGELAESVGRQHCPPARWVVQPDPLRDGPAVTMNRAASYCHPTGWLMFVGDDDLLDDDHIETVWATCQESTADVVYPWCRVADTRTGDGLEHVPPDGLQIPFDSDLLTEVNIIPGGGVAIRWQLWADLGGYVDTQFEDWDFWQRAVQVGARFELIPKVTWTWRLGPWAHWSDPR